MIERAVDPQPRSGGAIRVLMALLAVAGAAVAPGQELAPARGRFLVAERELVDPNFSETVVLIVDHDDDGAMGLIVNWPTAAPAAELLPHVEGLAGRADTVYVGGPVARQMMLMLVRSENDLAGAERIFADVHLSTSGGLLERVVGGEVPVGEFRLYSGYAGWAPGQLELELAAGGWRVLPAESEVVFAPDPERIWPLLMERSSVQWTRRATAAGELRAP